MKPRMKFLSRQTQHCSPNRAASGVIRGGLSVGLEIDVWSCGAILYDVQIPFTKVVRVRPTSCFLRTRALISFVRRGKLLHAQLPLC